MVEIRGMMVVFGAVGRKKVEVESIPYAVWSYCASVNKVDKSLSTFFALRSRFSFSAGPGSPHPASALIEGGIS
ncbi:hypothetical protein, partial [Alkalicoccus saliphilus]|uniref:hypothetical protein n=1 Tax=Alkalicoccus saliphilus TaxID=200989 RepID=UPI001C3F88D0